MAEVIWAEPALNDLDAIADYIALNNPEAARRLVQKIFEHVDILKVTQTSNRRAAVSYLLPRD